MKESSAERVSERGKRQNRGKAQAGRSRGKIGKIPAGSYMLS
jgi:hypothetical protein